MTKKYAYEQLWGDGAQPNGRGHENVFSYSIFLFLFLLFY